MKIAQLIVEKGSPARLARRAAERAAKKAGSNAFGNIANQLAGDPNAPTASSTGGVTTPSATGQTHVANPNNPNQSPTASDATQQAVPADQAQQTTTPAVGTNTTPGLGQKVAGAVGAVNKGIGAVGGGIAGALGKMKQGFQAGKAAVGGVQPTGNAPPVGNAPAGGSDNQITQLAGRISALEKAVGIAESYKFESKFLKMDI
jgi:hypothetical protein